MDEITAEIEAQPAAPARALSVAPKLSFGAKTDMGRVRENNEDKHEFFLVESDAELASRGHVFIVCDGMGGHDAGQIASEFAAKTYIEAYRSHPASDPADAARAAVLTANRFVLDVARLVPARRGMGTTLSALNIIQDKAVVAHVGDSRVYRLRGGELAQMTLDDTWVRETVSSGMMTLEQAEAHPYRHVLTQAIGTEDSIRVQVVEEAIEAGDVYLICSDGLTNHVRDEEIARSLGEATHPSTIAWGLVNKALVGGGTDNATAIVLRVDALEPREAPAQPPAEG